MRRDNIFTGAGFRSALYASIAFGIATLLLGGAIYQVVKTAMYHELKSQIREEVVLFGKIYQEGGDYALTETVKTLEHQYTPAPRLIGLFDKNKSKIGGNATLRPDFVGWKRVTQTIALHPSPNNYFALSTTLGRSHIVVGRHLSVIDPILRMLFWLLTVSGITAISVSLGIGYFASRRDSVKLNGIVNTLSAVSSGNSFARIEHINGNDQIDQIAHQINGNLDRLSSLMENTKNTATAIAHDLRTPINRASLILQEAKGLAGTETEIAQHIVNAEAELENISDIFDTILRISRIRSSSDNSGFSTFSLNALVSEMIETFQPVADDKNIRLRCTFPHKEINNLFGDRNMLRQALTNLIENALTYCPEYAEVEISAYRNQEQQICLVVSDNGPGIPDQSLLKVLEPFYRETSSRNPPGNGLGLALVNAVAIKHKGCLILEDNNPGLRVTMIFEPSNLNGVE